MEITYQWMVVLLLVQRLKMGMDAFTDEVIWAERCVRCGLPLANLQM